MKKHVLFILMLFCLVSLSVFSYSRADLSPQKALLGHWEVSLFDQKKFDYYYQENQFISVSAKTGGHSNYVFQVVSEDSSSRSIKLRQGVKGGDGEHEAEIRFSNDNTTAELVIRVFPGESGLQMKMRFIDDKMEP